MRSGGHQSNGTHGRFAPAHLAARHIAPASQNRPAGGTTFAPSPARDSAKPIRGQLGTGR